MFIDHAAATRPGRRTRQNEDAHEVLSRPRLFAVADGMGAAPDGARASRLALEAMTSFYRSLSGFGSHESDSPPSATSRMRLAFARANERIWRENIDANPLRRMGTTLVAAQFLSDSVVLGAVGDSRAYRWRDGQLTRLTRDHILLEDNRSHLTASEARDLAPLQNVLSRSVGRTPVLDPDVTASALEPDDLYLLCTNGLSDALPDPALADALAGAVDLPRACVALVERASAAAGDDDATAVLVRVGRPR